LDTLSHAAWGYAVLSRQRDLRWWAALAGAAPDLLWFIPSTTERVLEHGWSALSVGRDRGIWRVDGPPLPPELVDAYYRYYVNTHSLVLLAVVTSVMLMTRWRRWAWLALPYALHILMDIPTHERYQTQPFYPISSWRMAGLTWTDPRVFWSNVVALVLVYAWILARRRRTPRGAT
jgi:hypothetical protein